jgi:hypothetical protein
MSSPTIAWWGWLAIWGGLSLVLVAMLALFAWWLFRKFLTLMDDLGDLAETAELLKPDDVTPVRPELAVLAAYRDVYAERENQRSRASERSRIRHDKRIARAQRITRVDASMVRWPGDWY